MVNYRVSAIGAVEKPELTEVVSEAENRELPSTKEVRDVLFCHAKEWLPTPIYDRSALLPGHVLVGPVIIEQMDSTVVVPPGWEAVVDAHLNIRTNRKRV